MLIKIRKGWELPESMATPEGIALNRRLFLAGASAAGLSIASADTAWAAADKDPTADLYPAKRNEKFKTAGRAITPEDINSTYNNFYEFGSHKEISSAAQALKVRPWRLKVDGLCDKPFEIEMDDLVRKMPLEERVYRHRCVEAWSMVVPWTGFTMNEIVKLAEPKPEAKYVLFESFKDPKMASGQRQDWYPWPYTEGISIAEAKNELTLLVTGAYGKPLAKQFGAPMRLHLPWKYGFKSIKSVVRISFVANRPKSFWEQIQAQEYGFWANVNPEVPHPRWSQASERVLGTSTGIFSAGERIPTQIYNGYGEYVAGMYMLLQGEKLFY